MKPVPANSPAPTEAPAAQGQQPSAPKILPKFNPTDFKSAAHEDRMGFFRYFAADGITPESLAHDGENKRFWDDLPVNALMFGDWVRVVAKSGRWFADYNVLVSEDSYVRMELERVKIVPMHEVESVAENKEFVVKKMGIGEHPGWYFERVKDGKKFFNSDLPWNSKADAEFAKSQYIDLLKGDRATTRMSW